MAAIGTSGLTIVLAHPPCFEVRSSTPRKHRLSNSTISVRSVIILRDMQFAHLRPLQATHTPGTAIFVKMCGEALT